jgi:hypothetical protein
MEQKPTTCLPFSYTQSKITSNDLDSKEPSRSQRGYHFENSIKEVSLGLNSISFFDFNLHELKRQITLMSIPISYFRYDELYIDLEYKKKIKVQVHLYYDFRG